jgi:ankyrin repeat protein
MSVVLIWIAACWGALALGVLLALLWRVQHLTPSEKIHQAAFTGSTDGLCELLEAHPELVNARDEDGWSPLARAVFWGHVAVAEILLAHGADGDATPARRLGSSTLG